MTDKLEQQKCHHCGHEWEPRVKRPKKCPQCQNPLWVSPRPKKRKAAPTSIAASEAPAPTPPTTDTSTEDGPSDASGVDDSLEKLAENLGPLQPIYSRVEIDPDPEPLTKRLQREAEERLRRLADAPVD